MKSKIEQKIEKAREATNEMFAAFEELNEKLSEKLQPEFKVGDYLTMSTSHGDYIGILRKPIYKGSGGFRHYAAIDTHSHIHFNSDFGFQFEDKMDFSTPEEAALLDSKLAAQGKRFDKEKLELVDIQKFKVGDWFIPHKPKQNKTNIFWVEEMDKFDGVALQVSEPKFKNAEGIYSEVANWHFHPDWCEKTTAPKHKEPIIGEMAIGWSGAKHTAIIGIYQQQDVSSRPYLISSSWFDNAILFESPEQYKAFLKS